MFPPQSSGTAGHTVSNSKRWSTGSFGSVEVERSCKARLGSPGGPGDRTSASPRQNIPGAWVQVSALLRITLCPWASFQLLYASVFSSAEWVAVRIKCKALEQSSTSDKYYTNIGSAATAMSTGWAIRVCPHIPAAAAALPLELLPRAASSKFLPFPPKPGLPPPNHHLAGSAVKKTDATSARLRLQFPKPAVRAPGEAGRGGGGLPSQRPRQLQRRPRSDPGSLSCGVIHGPPASAPCRHLLPSSGNRRGQASGDKVTCPQPHDGAVATPGLTPTSAGLS